MSQMTVHRYEMEMQSDKLRFQEKRIDDLEVTLAEQRELLDKQIKEIEGWKKRHLLDPNGKMM